MLQQNDLRKEVEFRLSFYVFSNYFVPVRVFLCHDYERKNKRV
jgi:hypothetical protein